MRTRQTIVELFSTFLQFQGDIVKGWLSDPKLRRSIETSLNNAEPTARDALGEKAENYWALYWHKIWQEGEERRCALAANHLTAYLQESCYWTAKKMTAGFSGQSLADLFQTALVGTVKVLRGFNAQHGVNLKKYAAFTFNSVIKDSLRQRREVDICSNWALLHKVSQKRLTEALENQGLKEQPIACYLLAWKCFNAIYAPTEARTSRKLGEPDAKTWAEVAKLYNDRRHIQLSVDAPVSHPEALKRWLTVCGNALRSYLYPKQVSADANKPGQDSGSFLDDIPSGEGSLLEEIIEQERERERLDDRSQIGAVLMTTIDKLDDQSRQLLQLYYGKSLTQQQMAKELNIKQYTVSRRLASLRQNLLLSLATWSQQVLHYSLSSDVINGMSTILEEWLQNHYDRINSDS
jgi:RNA polymerase sigma factor (sigma-70 family)